MTDVDCLEFNTRSTTNINNHNNSTSSCNKYGTTSNLTDDNNDKNNNSNNNNKNVDLDVNKMVQLNTATTSNNNNNNTNNSNNLVLDIDIDNEESIKSLSIDYYEQKQHINNTSNSNNSNKLNQSVSLIDQKSNDYSFRSSPNNSAATPSRLIIIDNNNQQLLNATTTINSTINSDNNNNSNNNINSNRQLYDDTSSIRTTNSSNLSLNSAHLIIQNRNYESIVIRGDGNITIFGIFNRFNDEFPSKLAAKIAPEEYKDTIQKVNAILKKELSNSLKWLIFGSLCCCCTLGCSLLPVVYMNKKAKLSINKLLIIENERIYKKLGIKWRLTKQKCNSSSLFEYVILIDIIPALPLYQPD